MELDLNRRNSRWKQEEQRRKERAKQQLEMERKRREEAAKAQQEMEAIQSQKRQERLAEQQALEAQRLEEQRVTGGIKYLQRLRPVPTSNDGDKIILPASALQELDPQGAVDLGVFTFELTCEPAGKTHAGVLEFTAEEGSVGLPPKVARSLFPSVHTQQQQPSEVQVRFIRLDQGRFASLQPKGKGFGAREMDLKHVLERSLKVHTTLTVGDVLFVRHGRETFEVEVKQLRPEQAVRILNTDLEVDLMPCEEAVRAQELERRKEELERLEEEKQRTKLAWQHSKLETLIAEPATTVRQQVKIMVRLPSGQQSTRRFVHNQSLEKVMEWVEALVGEEKHQFQLVATFPRRVYDAEVATKTLQELGLATRQENLFVELKAQQQNSSTVEIVAPSHEPAFELPFEWQQARQQLEKAIDEQLQTHHPNNLRGIHALEPIMPVNTSASDQLTKWEAQLKELETMGFTDRLLNVQLLERYQGRLLRVVNYLSEL